MSGNKTREPQGGVPMTARDDAFAALVDASERVAILQPAARFGDAAAEAWATFYAATNAARRALEDDPRSNGRAHKEVTHGAPGQSRDRGETAAGATDAQCTYEGPAGVPADGRGVADASNADAIGDGHVVRDGGERPAHDAPVRSPRTPELPPGRAWAVQVVDVGDGAFATVFSAGVQHFTIAEGDGDDGRHHCWLIGQMFEGALRVVMDGAVAETGGADGT